MPAWAAKVLASARSSSAQVAVWLVTAVSTPTRRSPDRTGTETHARSPSRLTASAWARLRLEEPVRSATTWGSPVLAARPQGPVPLGMSAGSRMSTASPRPSTRTSRVSSSRWKATTSACRRSQNRSAIRRCTVAGGHRRVTRWLTSTRASRRPCRRVSSRKRWLFESATAAWEAREAARLRDACE